MTKKTHLNNEEKTISSIWDKKKFDPYLTSYTKIKVR